MRHLRALAAAALALLALTGCATATAQRAVPPLPRTERDRGGLIDTAQQVLVDRCLARQGLTLQHASAPQHGSASDPRERSASDPPDRRLQGALFGRGRPELSVTLATGYTVTAHTDGCLAAAERELYGDQRLWFRTRVVVNNLRAEAQQRMKRDPDYRDATARWTRCATPANGTRPGRPDPAVSTRCARESGLTRVRARLEPVLLARVRAERHGQLTTYRQLRTRALRRAADLYAERTAQVTLKKGSDPS
ncbi:hypothetical protein ACFXC8_53540 [Streptomyces sp. NPDC059441]|uniref:hypothetical protein n=1 Tax=Streptomyces sp. NPDC059441 TaxID=3346829 RepID=UPI0036910884